MGKGNVITLNSSVPISETRRPGGSSPGTQCRRAHSVSTDSFDQAERADDGLRLHSRDMAQFQPADPERHLTLNTASKGKVSSNGFRKRRNCQTRRRRYARLWAFVSTAMPLAFLACVSEFMVLPLPVFRAGIILRKLAPLQEGSCEFHASRRAFEFTSSGRSGSSGIRRRRRPHAGHS